MTRLGSCDAVAVVDTGSGSSNLTLTWELPHAVSEALKKKKKKKKKKGGGSLHLNTGTEKDIHGKPDEI